MCPDWLSQLRSVAHSASGDNILTLSHPISHAHTEAQPSLCVVVGGSRGA